MNLPALEGPRIGPFDVLGSGFSIKFLDKLGEGSHAVVWKVEINGLVYAIKMFNNYKVSDFTYQMELALLYKRGITDSQILDSMDPFNNECRAYGRICEANLTHIAAKCYGYLFLSYQVDRSSDEDEDDPRQLAWTRTETLKRDESTKRVPIRAIVKEYIESEHAFTPRMIPRMLRNIKNLHKHGIVHQDIRSANYKDGLLVDFSCAMTVPHYLLDIELGHVSKEFIYAYEISDAQDFDHMIAEWNDRNRVQIWHRFLPNFLYCNRLRSQQVVAEKTEGPEYDVHITRLIALSKRADEWNEKVSGRIKWHAADYDWRHGMVNPK
ncbi:kinetochore Sim4 complex subunit FTA2-domain-containing protein [Xylaria bambusicola]|uniref:kinetochore Sim4 complex subunit FTA2-domain-containing protein n=1 Tax=Xylaria bambusicola TaxID=326684 RepID=UPI002008E746|nr:kinetochore Sim4 complex subunit FTA2-domain-containing protein [Xylaria bambusicola]KAI0513292.1 kinetochore Sim4 complex subunit FTA2-domain-containing protein [Xylaria bambusicola]